MEFHVYKTCFDLSKSVNRELRGYTPNDFLSHAIQDLAPGVDLKSDFQRLDDQVRGELERVFFETAWMNEVRPYYKVWPSFMKCLLRVTLDCPTSIFNDSPDRISIRFAKGFEPKVCNSPVDACLITKRSGGLFIAFNRGERCTTVQAPSYGSEATIEEVLDSGRSVGSVTYRECSDILRIVASICILNRNPDYFTREVLSKDREAYSKTGDEKYVEKAKKRGVNGWSIGESYESCPHFRRPHFALRWTGKGGKVPKIVPVKAAVVHRKKMTDVPTGYILPNGQEVEP